MTAGGRCGMTGAGIGPTEGDEPLAPGGLNELALARSIAALPRPPGAAEAPSWGLLGAPATPGGGGGGAAGATPGTKAVAFALNVKGFAVALSLVAAATGAGADAGTDVAGTFESAAGCACDARSAGALMCWQARRPGEPR